MRLYERKKNIGRKAHKALQVALEKYSKRHNAKNTLIYLYSNVFKILKIKTSVPRRLFLLF